MLPGHPRPCWMVRLVSAACTPPHRSSTAQATTYHLLPSGGPHSPPLRPMCAPRAWQQQQQQQRGEGWDSHLLEHHVAVTTRPSNPHMPARRPGAAWHPPAPVVVAQQEWCTAWRHRRRLRLCGPTPRSVPRTASMQLGRQPEGKLPKALRCKDGQRRVQGRRQRSQLRGETLLWTRKSWPPHPGQPNRHGTPGIRTRHHSRSPFLGAATVKGIGGGSPTKRTPILTKTTAVPMPVHCATPRKQRAVSGRGRLYKAGSWHPCWNPPSPRVIPTPGACTAPAGRTGTATGCPVERGPEGRRHGCPTPLLPQAPPLRPGRARLHREWVRDSLPRTERAASPVT